MTRWEYAVVERRHQLNEWGAQGWELVAVTVVDGTERFYFKRPLPSLREQMTLEQRAKALGGGTDRETDGGGSA